jgi:hypothetical protein
MLKMVTGVVLVSSKACDVAQGYASAWTSPAASPDDHFEHPTGPMQNTSLKCCSSTYTSKFRTSKAWV